ncbi:MAG: DUF2232 domain-containing protein, partial [bacterium]|nr:DUF2232 domain-containing protein [bacterium]
LLPWMQQHYGLEKAAQYLFWLPGVAAAPGVPWHAGSFGLAYFVFYGALGWMLGYWEGKETNATHLGAKVVGVLTLVIVLWVLWQTGGNFKLFIQETENYFHTFLTQMTSQVPEDAGSELQDQLALLQTHGDKIVFYTVRLIPGMLMAGVLFIFWLNLLLARKLFIKDQFFKGLGPLKRWQLPFSFVWGLIGLALLLLGDIYFFKVGYFKFLALNLFIPFGLIYFLQGLAILAYYGQRWSIPPLVKLLGYLVFLIFFQPIGVILLGLGFFDSWFDFRKLAPKEASS